MKSLFTLFTLSFLSTIGVAQISETSKSMSQGTHNAILLSVDDADESLVSNTWKDFVKDDLKGKTKYSRRDKEYLTDDIDIIGLGKGNTVDLYALVEEKGSGVVLYLWCDLGGAYLSKSTHPDRFKEAEEILMRFGLEVERAKVRVELENEEKELKDLERELSRLKKDNDKYHKIIEKAEKAIEEAKADIQKNLSDQELGTEKIEQQKEVIESVKTKLKKI